jgi:hypothetical protein
MGADDVARMRELARTLTPERFAARFPWDFLAVVAREEDRTIEYTTRTGIPTRLSRGDVVDVIPLIKTTASTASSNTILVGRSRACDIALSDASVSKIHARVALTRGRATMLEDASSHNGTRVRGERIPPQSPVAVQSGDLIAFGSVVTVLLDAPGLHRLLTT